MKMYKPRTNKRRFTGSSDGDYRLMMVVNSSCWPYSSMKSRCCLVEPSFYCWPYLRIPKCVIPCGALHLKVVCLWWAGISCRARCTILLSSLAVRTICTFSLCIWCCAGTAIPWRTLGAILETKNTFPIVVKRMLALITCFCFDRLNKK